MGLIEGRPVGAVRLSFGWHSTVQHVLSFLGMVYDCFVDRPAYSWTAYLESIKLITPDLWQQTKIIAVDKIKHPEQILEPKITPKTIADESHSLDTDLKLLCDNQPRLTKIMLYPVKSCAGMSGKAISCTQSLKRLRFS